MSEKTKVYMVVGDNGSGNSGNYVFGLYPTEELAEARLKFCKENEMAEYVWITDVEVGENGCDCEVEVCG